MDVVPRLIPKIFEIGGDAEIAAAHELKSRIHRCLLVVLFNFAKAHGWCGLYSKPPPTRSAPARSRSATLRSTHRRKARLLGAADVDFVPYIVLLAFAGVRREELHKGLAWESINFERGTILVSAGIAKTGRKRKIDLAQNALAWLAPYRGKRGPIFKADPRKRMAKVSAVSRVK